MQPLFVMAHSGFQQQTRDSILHLNRLANQQMPVPQRAAAIPDLG
jgi:hypothetical protein